MIKQDMVMLHVIATEKITILLFHFGNNVHPHTYNICGSRSVPHVWFTDKGHFSSPLCVLIGILAKFDE